MNTVNHENSRFYHRGHGGHREIQFNHERHEKARNGEKEKKVVSECWREAQSSTDWYLFSGFLSCIFVNFVVKTAVGFPLCSP